jgi:membrane-associated phospholipid phosphatase
MQAVTFFSSSAVGLGLAAGAGAMRALRLRALFSWRAWLPMLAMISSAPVNFLLRALCGRLRPTIEYIPHRLPELSHPFQRWSYPSGHAMTATICYGMLVYLLGRSYPRTRYLGLAVLGLWLGAVGFSRVYLGVHWPADVLAGYLVGGAWLALYLALPAR